MEIKYLTKIRVVWNWWFWHWIQGRGTDNCRMIPLQVIMQRASWEDVLE